jgi:hypothetical protein
MWHRIDDPGVQEFQDLFLNHISHHIIKPTLGLPRMYNVRICRDAMSAEDRTNSFKVLE